ncbi:MAG: methylphosphotriester-DNA--protein-cysteine methyltransferase family protein, partial [Verrucomicrobiaceae bacterium]
MNIPLDRATSGPAKYATDEAKWQAVVRRDRSADRKFYYSVKTTGVYCVPSCGTRAALRRNVAFHDSPTDAESAGFRACKRCRPLGITLEEEHSAAVAKVCRVIETSDELPTLDILAKSAGMSRFYFHRTFKAITGLTPKAYAMAHRSRR